MIVTPAYLFRNERERHAKIAVPDTGEHGSNRVWGLFGWGGRSLTTQPQKR